MVALKVVSDLPEDLPLKLGQRSTKHEDEARRLVLLKKANAHQKRLAEFEKNHCFELEPPLLNLNTWSYTGRSQEVVSSPPDASHWHSNPGFCPVLPSLLVEVRLVKPRTQFTAHANNLIWKHRDSENDILEWRLAP